MKKNIKKILYELFVRFPKLKILENSIQIAYEEIIVAYRKKATLFICGNGGSAADADHMVGELIKGFLKKRELKENFKKILKDNSTENGEYLGKNLQQGLAAISLNSHPGLSSAVINDQGGDLVFAQQLLALGKEGDILFAISTSGNSRNVILACEIAIAKKIKIISLTGRDGGILKEKSDISIIAPAMETFLIQEYHLPIYHCLCAMIEEELY